MLNLFVRRLRLPLWVWRTDDEHRATIRHKPSSGPASRLPVFEKALASSLRVAHYKSGLLRHALTEFKDCTFAQHVGLLKVTKRVAKRLKATGDV